MKIRISYTLLKYWKNKNYDQLVTYYFKAAKTLTSHQMEEGLAWDKIVQEYVTRYSKLPDEFGGEHLTDGELQKKVEVSYNDQFDIVGVFDIYDSILNKIIEIKAGSTLDSVDYSNEPQIALYFLLAELSKLPVEYATIIHYDPTKRTTDKTKIYNTPYHRQLARNLVESSGHEIYQYFLKEGLI